MADARVTLFGVMRRPKWIGALVLALVVAAIFAALGQWQLSRAVTSSGPDTTATTEVAMPLGQLAKPGQTVSQSQDGQMVSVEGRFVGPDYTVVSTRLNRGVEGYWVTGRFDLSEPQEGASASSVAVALGWAPDLETAEASAAALNAAGLSSGGTQALTGRYVGSDAPDTKDSNGRTSAETIMSSMAVPALINQWTDFDDTANVFGGYVIASAAPAGLADIDSPAPQRSSELNLLNLFYAVEWVIFAGFAIFFWFRLVRDAWERETEEAELEEAFSAPSSTRR